MSPTFRTLGTGPPVLLIHGAAEDTTLLAPQAKAFADRGRRVIWADRRGTGTTSRDGWPADRPDRAVEGHADDQAALLRHVGDAPATVIGFSSGGVVALALAARYPHLVERAIAWEPAALGMLPDAVALHARIMAPIEAHLAAHPGDWAGAYRVMLDVLSGGRADHDAPVVQTMRRNAQAALRDDARLITLHRFESLPADLCRIAVSAAPDPLHLAIAERLAALTGQPPLIVPAADDHEVYLHNPSVLAEGLLAC